MTAGLTGKVMEMADIVALIDEADMRATIQKRSALLVAPPQSK